VQWPRYLDFKEITMDTPTRMPQRQAPAEFAHIKGWGVDLDHKNRPAYPMERKPPRLEGVHWDHPEQQQETVEVLVSVERPSITPIFGTTLPPSGLSGSLRRTAFRYSENDLRHWMLLLFADRVNMVEGIGSDLMRGKVPNIFAEMGGKAEFKYNREAAITKAVVVSSVVGIGLLLWAGSRSRRRRR
jgi:hypothetical protein